MTHIIEAHKRYAKARLVPTTITSLISLTHFHLVTFHSFFSSSTKAVTAPASNSDVSSIFATSSYPLPTLVPSLVETFLILIVLTTLALNALTQILTTGGIRGPLIGLIGHAGTLAPRWDEDFGVVLFRLGTASVEATCVKGFGNEVGGVEAGKMSANPFRRPEFSRRNRSQFGRKLAIKAAQQERDGGLIELNRSGVVSVYNARTTVGGRVKTTAIKKGFWNEIKHVKASTRQEELWADSLLNVPWYRGLGKFVIQMWRLVKRVWGKTKRLVTGRSGEEVQESALSETSDRRSFSRELSLSADEQVDVYERFLRGEDLGDEDDEEDGDFNPENPIFDRTSASDAEQDSGEEEELDSEDEEEEGVANDTLSLYADLSQDVSTPSSSLTSPSVLLAHLTSPGTLTRRRYSNLLHVGPANSMLDSDTEWIMQRRAEKAQTRSSEDDDSRYRCVICTAEPRQIICWPCRCLALCDDCRENLASRSAASKHICPCCRRK